MYLIVWTSNRITANVLISDVSLGKCGTVVGGSYNLIKPLIKQWELGALICTNINYSFTVVGISYYHLTLAIFWFFFFFWRFTVFAKCIWMQHLLAPNLIFGLFDHFGTSWIPCHVIRYIIRLFTYRVDTRKYRSNLYFYIIYTE